MGFFRVFVSVPDPLLVAMPMAMTMSMRRAVSALLATIRLSVEVVVVLIAGTADRHLTIDVVARDDLQLRVDVVSDESAVHLSSHVHHRVAEPQLDTVTRWWRATAHQLIPVHLLKVIVLRGKVGHVVEIHVAGHVVILVAVSIEARPLISGICENYERRAKTVKLLLQCRTGRHAQLDCDSSRRNSERNLRIK